MTHIYVQYPNGTVRDLTPGENVMAAFHSWSPDGRSFFFTTNERDPLASDLYEMTVDDYERDALYLNLSCSRERTTRRSCRWNRTKLWQPPGPTEFPSSTSSFPTKDTDSEKRRIGCRRTRQFWLSWTGT